MIADAHNDLLSELSFREDEGEENPFAAHWLAQLEEGGVELQVCAVYVEVQQLPEGALRVALKQAAAFWRLIAANPGRVRPVLTRTDLDGNGIGLLLALEGVEPLGCDPLLLDAFARLGVRMIGLTWNRRNTFADGAGEPGGLSVLGRELVGRFAELGIVLDLAHASERTFWDALEYAPDAQVMVSHACCRAVTDSPRNLSDEQLRGIAARGGVVGMMALPSVVDPDSPTLERFVDHFDHAVDVMGVEHVALGGDFIRQLFASGAARVSARERSFAPPGIELGRGMDELHGPAQYPELVGLLRRRGYDGDRLDAILRGNLLRVLRAALPAQ